MPLILRCDRCGGLRHADARCPRTGHPAQASRRRELATLKPRG